MFGNFPTQRPYAFGVLTSLAVSVVNSPITMQLGQYGWLEKFMVAGVALVADQVLKRKNNQASKIARGFAAGMALTGVTFFAATTVKNSYHEVPPELAGGFTPTEIDKLYPRRYDLQNAQLRACIDGVVEQKMPGAKGRFVPSPERHPMYSRGIAYG